MTRQSGPITQSLETFEDEPMRIGLGTFMHPTEERLRFIRQLGVRDVILNMYPVRDYINKSDTDSPLHPDTEPDPPLPLDDAWPFRGLVQLRNKLNERGLRLKAIESPPTTMYDDIAFGRDGRDRQIEQWKTTIRNMGRAGIPNLGYLWTPNGIWRTSNTFPVRAGAQSMAVDMDQLWDAPLTHDREYSQEEMWDNYEYFLREVLPVTEEEGVTLSLHPNDPPVESLGGVPQLFRSFENFKRAMDLVPSPNHKLTFCLGNWSAMGADIFEAIEYFGNRDELEYVDFQTISEPLPQFHETFIDQEGYYDPYEVLEAFDDAGFTGVIKPGHTPQMEGDGVWNERGRAFTVGTLKGMVESMRR